MLPSLMLIIVVGERATHCRRRAERMFLRDNISETQSWRSVICFFVASFFIVRNLYKSQS